MEMNGVNSGKVSKHGDNPEPSQGGNAPEGATTRGRGYSESHASNSPTSAPQLNSESKRERQNRRNREAYARMMADPVRREHRRKYRREYNKARYHSDPQFADTLRTRNREYLQKNPEKNREQNAAKYGLTLDQYNTMVSRPCQICGRFLKGKMVVDHCHQTGQIRGTLCGHCNNGIGFLGDTLAAVAKAAAYLQRFESPEQADDIVWATGRPVEAEDKEPWR